MTGGENMPSVTSCLLAPPGSLEGAWPAAKVFSADRAYALKILRRLDPVSDLDGLPAPLKLKFSSLLRKRHRSIRLTFCLKRFYDSMLQ